MAERIPSGARQTSDGLKTAQRVPESSGSGSDEKQTPPFSAQRRHPVRDTKRQALLTVSEAASILQISPKQIRRYIADPDRHKRLRSVKIGRLVRIDWADLEDFIRDHRRP